MPAERDSIEPAGRSPNAGATASPPGAGSLHRALSSFGVLLLTLSCLSPVFSIYGVGADVLTHAGSGAALLFLLGIAAAVVWAMVYAELGSAFPYAGGDYVGVGAILGPWAGIATLAGWAVSTGPSVAFEAKIIATYVNVILPGVSPWLITFGGLAAALVIALLAVRTGALVTGLFLTIEMAAVVLLIGAGLLHPVRGLGTVLAHPVVASAGGGFVAVPLVVLALAAISAVYGTVGGNQAIFFGEELADPHRRMGRVIVVAALAGAFATAVPVIAVVVGSPNLLAVLHSASPFSTFAAQTMGSWVGRALSGAVALAIFNATVVQIMTSARIFYSLGRDGLLNRASNALLAAVDARSGVPVAATLVVGAFSALCCLLSAHLLLVFLTGLLVYAWSLVCLAVLVGRRRGLTALPGYWRSPWFPLAPVLGLAMSAVFTVSDLADRDAGRPSVLAMGVVVAAALLWNHFVLQRRTGGWTPMLAKAEG